VRNIAESAASAGVSLDRRYVTALARGLDVLACFKFGERWLTHQEITRRTGLPKATVSRLTFTLASLGYLVHRPERGAYALGSGGLALGYRVLSTTEVAEVARHVMAELADYSRAAVSLGNRHLLSMVYVAHCRGQGRLTLGLDVGARLPIDTTSMGRALLCALEPTQREELCRQLKKANAEGWAARAKAIDRAVADYRRLGFATSQGEWEPDISAVGVALVVGDGKEPYVLTIGGPSSWLTHERLHEDLGPRLVEAAGRIRDALLAGRTADAATY
jgi:DNA-binding IclR family transcriptional regulator